MKVVAMVLLALAICTVADTEDAADTSGGGWRPVRMDLTVAVDAAAERVRLEGTMRLRLEIAASTGPAIGINGRDELFKFVEVRGPASSTVTLGKGPERAPNVRTASCGWSVRPPYGDEVDLSFVAQSTTGAATSSRSRQTWPSRRGCRPGIHLPLRCPGRISRRRSSRRLGPHGS